MNVCIPSKGRAGSIKTLRLLDGYDKVLIFVEPQDYDAYVQKHSEHSKIINIGENDMGIAFVRNYIMDYCFSVGINYPWMIDDDMLYIFKRTYFKYEKNYYKLEALNPSECLEVLKECHYNFLHNFSSYAQYGISYKTLNAKVNDMYMFGGTVWAIGMNNVKLLKECDIRYDLNLSTFEDYDLVAQCFLKGLSNVVSYKYSYANVRFATNKSGGLQKVYDNPNVTRDLCAYLKKKYPNKVTVSTKKLNKLGIYQARFLWGKMKNDYVSKTTNEQLGKWTK